MKKSRMWGKGRVQASYLCEYRIISGSYYYIQITYVYWISCSILKMPSETRDISKSLLFVLFDEYQHILRICNSDDGNNFLIVALIILKVKIVCYFIPVSILRTSSKWISSVFITFCYGDYYFIHLSMWKIRHSDIKSFDYSHTKIIG